MGRNTQRITLAALVGLHLLVSVAHGLAHGSAGVNLGAASMAFVFLVIMAGPLVGLAWMWRPSTSLGAGPTVGARVIGVTMAASLVFGLVNHFIIAGADRVDHVVMEWQTMFGATAAMLAVIEAAGAWLGFRYGSERNRSTYAPSRRAI
jgi:hypothetical protein